jgi:hypothetical protein
MIDTKENTVDNPNSRAIARLSVVSGIQLLGVLIIALPLWRAGRFQAGWQTDCLWIAVIVGGGTLGVLFAIQALVFPWLETSAKAARIAERLIPATFVLNTIACFLAVARTGGPVNSIFGPLIPIQLSGILVLEQQKEKIPNKLSRLPWVYAGVSITLWLIAHCFWPQVNSVFNWTFKPVQLTGLYATSAAVVTAIGMGFTATAYFLPTSRWFRDLASKITKE